MDIERILIGFALGIGVIITIFFSAPRAPKTFSKKPINSKPVEVISKHKLPFKLPIPSESISGVLYDNNTGTYCLFALSFPELHLIIKPPKKFSQNEMERLARLFSKTFKLSLRVKVFVDDDSGSVVESLIH